MLKAKKTAKTVTSKLPMGLTQKDLTYPKFSDKDQCDWQVGDQGRLTLYEVTGRRGETWWAIATLGIAKGRRGHANRTYAAKLDGGALVRVGQGPHVLRTVTVYLRKSRLAAMKPLLDLHLSGQVSANQVRDRISSRRAQGQLMRAEGRHSWRWDS